MGNNNYKKGRPDYKGCPFLFMTGIAFRHAPPFKAGLKEKLSGSSYFPDREALLLLTGELYCAILRVPLQYKSV